MSENTRPANKHSLWLRGIYMLLMTFIFHLAITVMLAVALLQFVLALLNSAANDRLVNTGRGLGRYLQQITNFLTFAVEEVPYPFSDWPAAE